MNDTHPDPYAVLGVAPTATTQQINRAYRRLLRDHHPDTRSGGDALADSSGTVSLADPLTAYAVLRDPVARAEHDRRRPPAPGPAPAPAPGPAHRPRPKARRGLGTVDWAEADPAVRVDLLEPTVQAPEIRVGPVIWRPAR